MWFDPAACINRGFGGIVPVFHTQFVTVTPVLKMVSSTCGVTMAILCVWVEASWWPEYIYNSNQYIMGLFHSYHDNRKWCQIQPHKTTLERLCPRSRARAVVLFHGTSPRSYYIIIPTRWPHTCILAYLHYVYSPSCDLNAICRDWYVHIYIYIYISTYSVQSKWVVVKVSFECARARVSEGWLIWLSSPLRSLPDLGQGWNDEWPFAFAFVS